MFVQIKQLCKEVIYINLDTYLRISYLDVLSQEQHKCYKVQVVKGTTIIDKKLCIENIKFYNGAFKNSAYYRY